MTPEAETLIPSTGTGCCMQAGCTESAGHSCLTLACFLVSLLTALSSCNRVSSSQRSALHFLLVTSRDKDLVGRAIFYPTQATKSLHICLLPLHICQGTMENNTALATSKLKSEKNVVGQRRCEMKNGSVIGRGSRFYGTSFPGAV